MPGPTRRVAFARATVAGALVFIAGATVCTTAHANGRFPEAQTFESVPGSDGATLFLRTTFGVLVSRDHGRRWRWICERALGYEGQWDPPIAVTRDGRLWVGLEDGLLSTRDGCEVEAAPELDGEMIKDLTTDALGETVWAITGVPGKKSFVWRRRPGGRFERLASMGETNVMTIEVAPSLPSRVYVSGQPYTTIRGQIFRSDDGGMTFRSDAVVGPDGGAKDGGVLAPSILSADGPLFIGSVDPQDPSRLLVRHLHGKGSDLYLSKDGGRTLAGVLSMKSAMFGFAKSADGKTIWAGSGLAEHGLFRSTDRGEHFDVVSRHGVLCLHAAASDALFVCDNALTAGAPAISVARDGAGTTITPLARFADIEGPVECATPDARASLCTSSWPSLQALLTPASDAGPNAKPSKPDERGPRRSACSCDVVGSASSTAHVWWLLTAMAVVAGARVRSHRDRSC